MDNDSYRIYNLIKVSICKYIITPLKCSKEDIEQLSLEIKFLIINNNYNYDKWNETFNKYLNIQCQGELDNLISYVKNYIQ